MKTFTTQKGRDNFRKSLVYQFGSLRSASKKLNVNYYRLVNLLKGHIVPSSEEMTKLKRAVELSGGGQ